MGEGQRDDHEARRHLAASGVKFVRGVIFTKAYDPLAIPDAVPP
jgi:hypothetical protein